MRKMLNEEQILRQIEYWVESSEDDYKAMNNSYASKDYVWSLFIGHLAIEKLLKAVYSKKVKKLLQEFITC